MGSAVLMVVLWQSGREYLNGKDITHALREYIFFANNINNFETVILFVCRIIAAISALYAFRSFSSSTSVFYVRFTFILRNKTLTK